MPVSSLSNVVSCELCGAALSLDVHSTIGFYDSYIVSDLDEIKEGIDNIIAQCLVYKCSSCSQTYKYTYKEIEKAARKKLTEKFLMYYNKEPVKKAAQKFKYFIYCGKCQGFDGQGCCPQSVYENCEIKRFPLNDI